MVEAERIPCPLRAMATDNGDTPAVITSEHSLSFAALDKRVDCYLRWLGEKEIRPGERVALLGGISELSIVLLFAMIRKQAVAVLPSLRWPEKLLAESLNHLTVTTVIVPKNSRPRIIPSGTKVIECNSDISAGTNADHHDYVYDENQLVSICFSSGTTARPKAVLHTFGNHYYSALGSNTNLSFQPGDRWLVSLPLYHVGGLSLLFRAITGGGACVVPEPDLELTGNISKYKVTHLSLVATQLRQLLDLVASEKVTTPGTLKAVLIGGGPVPQNLIDRALKLNLPLYRTYGLTEMASQVASSKDKHAGPVYPLPYREIKLSDQSEILVRGKTLFAGYVHGGNLDPARDQDGWFSTGDLGKINSDRSVQVIGRKDNMFISGGENIHPETIERALLTLEGIKQAVVVPVDDVRFGQRPVAFVESESKPDYAMFESELRKSLPGYMIPVAFYSLPDEQANRMKPDRAGLRQLARSLTVDS